MLADFLAVVNHSWDLDQKGKSTELIRADQTDLGDKTAEQMMMNFSESGHPIFRAYSACERGELKSKEGGKNSIHFNGSA